MYKGDSCKMGSTVVRGEVEATVEATGANTFFGRTAALLVGGDEVSNLQKLLIRIMVILVVLSMTLCLIAFGYLLGRGETLRDALSFTVVLLVASIPIAIEIVCTTTLALGSHELSKDGAIVSRLAAIEDMAGMSILCSDKTGTLTLNKMAIQEETPIYLEGETQYSLLRYAAMASKWTEPPRDALDTLVHGCADMKSLENIKQLDYMPFDPMVKRTEGTVKLPTARPSRSPRARRTSSCTSWTRPPTPPSSRSATRTWRPSGSVASARSPWPRPMDLLMGLGRWWACSPSSTPPAPTPATRSSARTSSVWK